MTRVIRNRAGLYFKGRGQWTDYFPHAEKFANTEAAVAIKNIFRLQDVDLVLVIRDYPSPQCDVVLPLT